MNLRQRIGIDVGRRLARPDYIRSADVLVLYMVAVTRDPYGGKWDPYCKYVADFQQRILGKDVSKQIVHVMSRSWMHAISLEMICRGFMVQYPDETSFHGKMPALYEWLGEFRTDRGPHFGIGYTPTGVTQDVDGAFSDDLGWVGETSGWLAVTHLGVLATAAAYLLFASGLETTRSTTATTLSLGEPATAALLGVIVIGERPPLLGWVGFALLLVALLAVATEGRSNRLAPRRTDQS